MRVVRRPDGDVAIDPTGTLEGRGAYLCADGACWATALKRKSIERALGRPLPDHIRSTLEHADVAAVRTASEGAAPPTIAGGTHGA